jgi:hypothetical protein
LLAFANQIEFELKQKFRIRLSSLVVQTDVRSISGNHRNRAACVDSYDALSIGNYRGFYIDNKNVVLSQSEIARLTFVSIDPGALVYKFNVDVQILILIVFFVGVRKSLQCTAFIANDSTVDDNGCMTFFRRSASAAVFGRSALPANNNNNNNDDDDDNNNNDDDNNNNNNSNNVSMAEARRSLDADVHRSYCDRQRRMAEPTLVDVDVMNIFIIFVSIISITKLVVVVLGGHTSTQPLSFQTTIDCIPDCRHTSIARAGATASSSTPTHVHITDRPAWKRWHGVAWANAVKRAPRSLSLRAWHNRCWR